MPTEQESLDALLAREIPPELREALTEICVVHFPDNPCLEHPDGRFPLPLDSAHVAAERWVTVDRLGEVNIAKEDVVVVLDMVSRTQPTGTGPDIFAAIQAALEVNHAS